MDGEEVGGLEPIQATLRQHIAQLDSDPYLELGTRPARVRAIVRELESASTTLKGLAADFKATQDIKAFLAYTAALETIRQAADFMRQVAAGGRGTAENTRHARDLLVDSLAAVNALLGKRASEEPLASSALLAAFGETSLASPESKEKRTPPSSDLMDTFGPSPTDQNVPSKVLAMGDSLPTSVVLRTRLLESLIRAFSLQELKTLCFRLDIEYEDLNGQTISALAREMIAYAERREGLYEALVREAEKMRPGLFS